MKQLEFDRWGILSRMGRHPMVEENIPIMDKYFKDFVNMFIFDELIRKELGS